MLPNYDPSRLEEFYQIVTENLCIDRQIEQDFLYNLPNIIDCAKLKDENCRLNEIIIELRNKCTDLERDNQILNRNIKQYQNTIAFLMKQNNTFQDLKKPKVLDEIKECIESATKSCQTLQNFIPQLPKIKTQITQKLLSEREQHQKEIFKLSSEIEEIKKQLAEKERDIQDKDMRIQNLINQNTNVMKEKDEEIIAQQQIINRQMTIAKKENEEQIARIVSLHEEEINNLILLLNQ